MSSVQFAGTAHEALPFVLAEHPVGASPTQWERGANTLNA